MDTLAHGLWAAIGIAAMQPRFAVPRAQAATAVALAVAPGLLQGLPLLRQQLELLQKRQIYLPAL